MDTKMVAPGPVGIRAEKEVDGVAMGVMMDEGENGTKVTTVPCREIRDLHEKYVEKGVD